MKVLHTITICTLMASCTTAHVNSDGLVEFAGRQADIVGQNNIAGLVPIAAISGSNGMYGLGAYEGLDGEITIFQGRPHITQVRGGNIIMRHHTNGSAIFAAWTKNDTCVTSQYLQTLTASWICSALSGRALAPPA